MQTIHSIKELQACLSEAKNAGKSVGLVPTMGALHEGHASLVRRSVKENDVTVVSIFLNPTQFNDPKDLERYPRTLESDCKLLEQCGAQIAFAPSVSEMYPEPDTRSFSYPPTDSVMEGARRPGHFNGVCQIVSKLFMITEPDRAYFGEKDFQQICVIRCMVADLGFKMDIVPCPVIREASGLAMSSRNTYLSAEDRPKALALSRALDELKRDVRREEELDWAPRRTQIVRGLRESGLYVDYVEAVDAETLSPVETLVRGNVVLLAVYCGGTRLIDNAVM